MPSRPLSPKIVFLEPPAHASLCSWELPEGGLDNRFELVPTSRGWLCQHRWKLAADREASSVYAAPTVHCDVLPREVGERLCFLNASNLWTHDITYTAREMQIPDLLAQSPEGGVATRTI